MSLDYKQISIPFGQGLAEHTAPYLIRPGKSYVAEQAIIDKDGSIQVRPGSTALELDIFNYGGDPNTLSAGAHLFSHDNETLITTPYRLLSYQDADEQWQDIDDAYEVDITRIIKADRAGADGTENYKADCAIAGNWIVYAWINYTEKTLKISFVDYYTGAHVLTKKWDMTYSGSDVTMVRLVVAGGKVHMFWHDQANLKIMDYFFDYSDIEAAHGTLEVGALTTSYGQFDACVNTDGDDGYVYVAYAHDNVVAPDGVMCVKIYNTGAGVHSFHLEPLKGAGDQVNAQIGIAVDDDNIWVAYDTISDEINAFAKLTSGISTTVVAATLVRAIYSKGTWSKVTVATPGAQPVTGYCLIAWEQDSQNATNTPGGGYNVPSLDAALFNEAGTVTDGHKTYWAGLLSRPWYYNSTWYIVGYVYHQQDEEYGDVVATSYQRNAYILELRIGVRTVPEE